MRLFVALAIPDDVADSLTQLQSGIPGARWSTRDQIHLTLRFIGEIDGGMASAVDDALASIRSPFFHLALKTVGHFGGKNPSALWAAAESNDALMHLQRKIESALQRVGIPADTRKYTPHVTLARLRSPPRGRVLEYLADHALFASRAFEVLGFILYSSQLTPKGSLYRAERAYQLQTA